MSCPECNKEKKSHFDKLAIKLLRKCVDCKIKWEERPENNPNFNKYVIKYYFGGSDEVTIYAESKEDAKDEFYNGSYGEGEECEIGSVSETTREELNEAYKKAYDEQTKRQMGDALI